MPETVILASVFVLGLLVGSFLNVCIYRIPLGVSFVRGRSYCPHCRAAIAWYHNIPVLSYLLLGGRCRHCADKISPRYPAVELLNGALYLLVYAVHGASAAAALVAALFSILVVISLIDLAHQIIPDGLVIAILVLGAVHAVYQSVLFSVPWHTWVIGFFAASVPLFLLGLIYSGGMGGGDIKLMAAAGLFVGWQLILLSLFLGALYGGAASAFLLLTKRGSMKTAVPFGPALSLGIITSALVGRQLIDGYIALFLL